MVEGGAESGYYLGLQPGYECANDEFNTVYELSLIRGMTREIYDRIVGSVTVYGSGKINLNTADKAVLDVLAQSAGADVMVAEGLAEKIMEFRSAGGGFSEASAMSIAGAIKGSGVLGAEDESILMQMMGSLTLKGSCFRGIAEGHKASFAAVSAVEFVYSREKERILFWRED